MEAVSKIPIVVLAGSDRRPGAVPAGAEQYHFLVGYKGADLQIGDRSLIQELVDRIRSSDAFGEIFVAGPARVFADLVDCSVIDTDGTVGDNIQAATTEVCALHGPDTRVAFLSCDVLPSAAELAELTAALTAREAADGAGDATAPALALSVVRVPAELGASAWKPKYVIRTAEGEDPVPFLPGHLGVACPKKLRTGLLFRSIHLVYKERNRDYEERRRGILFRLVGALLARDVVNLVRLQPPTLTYAALRYGLGAFLAWRRNELTLDLLATAIEKVVVRRKYHRRPASGCVRLVVTPHVSFARDIDTLEELEEIDRDFRQAAGR